MGYPHAAENRRPDVLIHTFADDHRLSLGKGERFEFLIRTTTVQEERLAAASRSISNQTKPMGRRLGHVEALAWKHQSPDSFTYSNDRNHS